MATWTTLFALVAVCGGAIAIECYTGWTYVKGQPFATGSETCSFKKYCYNLTLDSASITDGVKKAGCSSFRCMLLGIGCHKFEFAGQKLTLCCCSNGDKCNSKYSQMKTMGRIKEGLRDAKNMLEDVWKKMESPFGR